MLVIPVLDLLGGVVVRGVAGNRDSYKPIESQLTDSSDPLEVAKAIRSAFGYSTFYVADLDAILSGQVHSDVISSLIKDGFDVLLDAGTGDADQVDGLSESVKLNDLAGVIIGLESVPKPEYLSLIKQRFSDLPMAFSLDLMNGVPITHGDLWQGYSPTSILDMALEAGMDSIILLDLASVGMGTGNRCLEHCDYGKMRAPDVNVITGGGVRSREDLYELEAHGCDGALVASALHDGRLS